MGKRRKEITKNWVQHIGDDQLVYGMPKRMVGVSTQESLAKFKKAEAKHESNNEKSPKDPKGNYYWTVLRFTPKFGPLAKVEFAS